MENKNKALSGAMLVIGAGIMWGHSTYFVHKLCQAGLGETGAAVTRLAVAFLMLAVYMLIFKRKELHVKPKAVLFSVLGGLIGMVFCTVIYYYSINENGSAIAAVLMYTSPAIVVILARFIFKEKITLLRLISLILAFAGTVFVSGLIGGNDKCTLIGLVFGAITGIAYALYSIFSSLAMQNGAEPLTVIFYALGSSAVAITLFAAFKGELAGTIELVKNDTNVLWLVLGQSSFDCVFPYIAYTIGVKFTGASKASIMSTTEIVVAAIIGFVSFGETLGFFSYAGIALVIASIVLLNIEKQPQNADKPGE